MSTMSNQSGIQERLGGNQIRINWIDNPHYDEDILDWLDAHPLEREILLLSEPQTQGSLSKRHCLDNLAKKFCAPGGYEDWAKLDLARARSLLQARFYNLQVKYKQVLDVIGPVASQKKYEDIVDGSDIHIALVEATKGFAIWKRLHHYWRLSPHHNHFHAMEVHSTSEPTVSGSERPALRNALSTELGSRVKRRRKDFEDAPPPKRNGRLAEHEEVDFQEGSSSSNRHKGKSLDIKHIGQAGSMDGLTPDQKHELRLAEIRLKQTKVELELERTKAKTVQRNQEFQLRVLGMTI